MTLDACEGEDFSEAEMEWVMEDIVIPEMVIRFAEHYTNIDNCYDDNPDPNTVFRTFVKFEHLSEDLANTVADVINKATAQDSSEDEDDDNEVVFKGEKEWQELTATERQAKLKTF
jgi:hypothetical protein